MDSRDSGSEDASGVSLGVIDKEHFDSAKEVVVGRAKGAGKAVEGTSYSGNSIMAAHEGGAMLNGEEFEMVRRQERARLEKQSIIDNPLFGDVNKSPGKSAGDAEARRGPIGIKQSSVRPKRLSINRSSTRNKVQV